MDLWIQPCARCPDLYGKAAAESAHQDLTLTGAGAVKDERVEEPTPVFGAVRRLREFLPGR